MSASGLQFTINSQLQNNQRLVAYYDFGIYSGGIDPNSVGPYTGILYNHFPAFDTGKYVATVLSATGSTTTSVLDFISGSASGTLNLNQTNLQIPSHELKPNNMSAIIDFAWDGEISNGVLIGCFSRVQEILGSITVTGSRGFNFGFNDRGGLFFEAYRGDGPIIFSTSGIELSKRNMVGLSIYGNQVILSQFDFFNNEVYSEEFSIEKEYLADVSNFYIGGSPRYFRTTGVVDPTMSGSLASLCLFSGALSAHTLKNISSGMIGDYFYDSGSVYTREFITGYTDEVIYKTGVTGYSVQEAGTLTVSTGRLAYTGVFQDSSGVSGGEGDDTYLFYTFDNGSFKTAYKERIGYLDQSNNFAYAPTGEGAFDTLGLQTGSFSLSGDVNLTLETRLETGSYSIYEKTALYGQLEDISGVNKTPLFAYTTGYLAPSSGITFTGDIESFKRNYIYYKGIRK